MDPENIEKPFHDSTVYELERSVSLCTLCELETKYLYTDTPTYSLSLPVVELSSTSDDFSSLHFTPERSSVYDHFATVGDTPRSDDIAVEGPFPIHKSTKDAALKIAKKSPDINDDDISSSFLEFVQKTAKQVPDGLSKTLWDDVSWDKSDEKRESENSRGKTALATKKNSAIAEVTENGINSFISDIDDFLNEDKDKPVIEISGESRVRQVSPPRNFISDIRDEIPRKRSKISAISRRFIDTPEPTKFSEGFMNRDNSMNQERSKNFAEDFRVSSVIISRERQSAHGLLQDRAESLSDENIFSTKSVPSKMSPEGQKVSEATPNCTHSFMDEQVREKSRNNEMLLPTKMRSEERSNADEETLWYEGNKMAAGPRPVQFSLIYGEREKIDSQGREDMNIFVDDDKIPRKKLKIEKTRKNVDKRSVDDNFRKPEAKELPDEKSNFFANDLSDSWIQSPEVPKSEEIDHGFVENGKNCEKSIIDNEEEIPRSSVKSLPEVEEEKGTTKPEVEREMNTTKPEVEGEMDTPKPEVEGEMDTTKPEVEEEMDATKPEVEEEMDATKPEVEEEMDTTKPEVDRAMPSDEGTVKETSPKPLKIIANMIVEPPLQIQWKPRDGNDRAESEDTSKKHKEKMPKINVPTNEDPKGKKLVKKIAEIGKELPERNERNRESHCPEKPTMAEINCDPDYTKTTEEKSGEQFERVENFITDGVSESPKGASRKKQNQSDKLKPEDKEKLTKSWKEVRKDFASTKDKRPRYPPLAVPKTPPLPDLKMIKARAAKRRGVLADAINRLSRLNSYMGEVRNIFRNDNKQYSIVKPTRSSNGRIKILVSTSTQTSDGGEEPIDSLPIPPSTTTEGTAEKQLEQPDIKHAGLFYYNLFHPQRDLKDEEISAQKCSKPTHNDKSSAGAVASVSEANTQNTRPELPSTVEKNTTLHNQEETKYDMHTYNPLRVQRAPKRIRKTVPNNKPTPTSCKPLFLNRLL